MSESDNLVAYTIGIFKSCPFSADWYEGTSRTRRSPMGPCSQKFADPALGTPVRAGLREWSTKAVYDDSTSGLESPEREDVPLFLRNDCPECGRALADHGLSTVGPCRTRLAPCGFDVAGVKLRGVAFALDAGARRVAADGGEEA
ncbi:hypothetical protein [Halobaculum rubrum]|uniref:hypothetical protein n=1 Tax=Halobaculum rubrum TaxID=2872158 RepID=UPI001CA39CAC|nr:hypothetical protein [Halobaculum rubrum]QZX98711.1 hypothetical protein K6T25_10535 [Halobaculum rubrum]